MLRLVLPVLESKGCHVQRRAKLCVALDAGAMDAVEDFAKVGC